MSELKDREAADAYAKKVGCEDWEDPVVEHHKLRESFEQGISYGRANPLPQPDGKDMREMLKRFHLFNSQHGHTFTFSDEIIDEFLSQEQK